MRELLAPVAALCLGGCATAPDTQGQANSYDVYFLGGQSNMEGFGYVAELPDELRASPDNVVIFHGRTVADGEDGGGMGAWAPLSPGHGFESEVLEGVTRLSDRFGPEVSFGHAIAAGEQHVALIKYSRGGTALVDGVSGFGSWDPDYTTGNGRNQLDNALTTMRMALRSRDVDGDGIEDRLVPAGIVWMQGEADAYDSAEASRDYAVNLARLVAIFRQELGSDNLPIVIGRIRDSGDTPQTRVMKFSPDVRAAQARFVAEDRCAALVTASDDFEFLPDGWHYTSKDYVTLGQAFAKSMIDLKERCR